MASDTLEIKSQLSAEFRRISINKSEYNNASKAGLFDNFYNLLQELHKLQEKFLIFYTARDEDVLPINNSDNLKHAICSTGCLLRLQIHREDEYTGYLSDLKSKRKGKANQGSAPPPDRRITVLDDFRKVSSIIDVDAVPESYRRVKLMRSSSTKPLGFYIRDGSSIRVTPNGIVKVPAIFISRLLPGGLAESTGLLAVNDEVIEVNGIEVSGKSIDQVTDMMVANSSNLILTTKPVNQSNCLQPNRRSRASQLSHDSDTRSYFSDSGATDLASHHLHHHQPNHQQHQQHAAAAVAAVHRHSGSLPVSERQSYSHSQHFQPHNSQFSNADQLTL